MCRYITIQVRIHSSLTELLTFIPGLSLLLGQTGTSGSGDGGGSNTTLIVVISVVVPVAILVVILVVAAGLILLFVRRYLRARAIRSSGAVNFDPERPDSGEVRNSSSAPHRT